MDIKQIIDYISDEYSKGNKDPYKKLYSFCVRVWRNEHKQKVAEYNQKYQKKIRINLNKNKIIKNKSYIPDNNKNKSYKDSLGIFD